MKHVRVEVLIVIVRRYVLASCTSPGSIIALDVVAKRRETRVGEQSKEGKRMNVLCVCGLLLWRPAPCPLKPWHVVSLSSSDRSGGQTAPRFVNCHDRPTSCSFSLTASRHSRVSLGAIVLASWQWSV